MGRNAKPTDLHVAEGNPNRLTKEEIKRRKDSEVKLGQDELKGLKVPSFVRNDEIAFKYWKQLIKEYKKAAEQGVQLLTSSDIGMLALYCKTYSEYEGLQNIEKDNLEIEAILKIETSVNKKMDMLIKMQDRLFLNPLAKIKNISKPKTEDKKPSKFSKFGGGKGG